MEAEHIKNLRYGITSAAGHIQQIIIKSFTIAIYSIRTIVVFDIRASQFFRITIAALTTSKYKNEYASSKLDP